MNTMKKRGYHPRQKLQQFYGKYKHAVPLLVYAFIYMAWFVWLEKNRATKYTLIHMALDDYIPFCEWFVIPYFLWFAYVSVSVLWLFFRDKDDYYRTCIFLFTGMTVFLLVSTLFPNGHHLRPQAMPGENVLTALVSFLYRTDTPTNLWPSIHVYNSLGAHFAVIRNERLAKKRWVRAGSLILCVSIILSTMFIKQHSVFDVMTAFIMAAVMYGITYKYDILTAYRGHARTRRNATQLIH